MLCIVRRWLANRPIFSADRDHIHHRLLDRELTVKQSVLILYGFCAIGAMFSIVQSFLNDVYVAGAVAALFLGAVWAGVHHLNYAELMLASRLLRAGELQSGVRARLALSAFERSIRKARSLDECCLAVADVYQTFGFAGVRIVADGTVFEIWPPSIAGPKYWIMRLPLSRNDYMELARPAGSSVLPTAAIPFLDLLGALLTEKLEEHAAVAAESVSAVR
jgi:UDP-GlcNAc:undecaprenyl-phosphate GlcNAc-1-phosphate transferase